MNGILPRWSTEALNAQISPLQSNRKDVAIEVEHANINLVEARKILDQLRQWHDYGIARSQSLRRNLWSRVFPQRPPCPSQEQLKQLATFFFPPRASLEATICDYGDGHFNYSKNVPICDLEPGTSAIFSQISWEV